MALPKTSSCRFLSALITLFCCVATATDVQAAPDVEAMLAAGKFEEAIETLNEHLDTAPDDQLARFQLGTTEVFRAAEQLAQEGAKFGTLSRTLPLPFIRMGGFGKRREDHQPVTYQDVRQMVERFQERIHAAEETLAGIDATELDWRLDFSRVAFDFDGNGERTQAETLDRLFRFVARTTRRREDPKNLVVDFDAADAYWLRGYCHVLQAMADMTLAYDHDRLFQLVAHAFFTNPQTDYTRKQDDDRQLREQERVRWGQFEDFADLVATVHLMNFKLIEPRRMQSAREHLLEVVKLSRRSWELIEAETDQRNEWIPGANQTSVIPRLRVGPEQINAWQEFLTESEAILNGEKLVPMWRTGFSEGINLRRVFDEPRDFDLILWLQGAAALPYLEEGEQTQRRFWVDLQRTFRGQFFGFALWTN